jgi:TonB-linked SusC/RagA family outer membrane protein
MENTFRLTTFLNRCNNLFVMDAIKNKGKMIAFIKWNFLSTCLPCSFTKKSFITMNKIVTLGNMKRFVLLTTIFVLYSSVIQAQTQDTLVVKGTVVNGSNEPVPNVSVTVEGTFEIPSVTNESGEFTVKAPTGFEWLNVEPSSDYKTKRIFLNNRTELVIYLTENELFSGFDEITVLSQPRLKRNIVSSYSVLNIQKIKQSPAVSVDQFLQGRVSGLHVVSRSGYPGSGAFALMRGINSINASNQPLYIVDGIPVTSKNVFGSNLDGYSYNPLLSINNLDISKLTVIKDPTLTAAYGSKASNGLIVIETLAPSAIETTIDFDFRSGYSLSPSNLIPQLNAGQHKTLISEVLESSGKYEELILEEYPNLYLTPDDDRFIDYQHSTNWQDIIFSNAAFSNLNVNVKGGDEIARYGLSFGYMNAGGIVESTKYDGFNLRFVSLLNIFPWLKMDAGMSLNYSSSQLKESAKVAQTNPIIASLGKSPMLNPFQYDREGREINSLAPVDELGVSNPQAVIHNYEASNNNVHFISTIGVEATLSDNFVLNSKFGLTYNVLKELIFMPNQGMELYYDDEAFNVSKGTNNSHTSLYNNTYLKYDKALGNDHYFTSNTGINILTNDFELDWGLTKNSHENDQYRKLQDGTNNLREIGGENRNWNWISFYENVTYSYRDKYLVSGSVSLDGSSRLGDNATNTIKINSVPFGIFYAGGLGWRVSNEPFLNRFSWLEEFKLRLTYGFTGNDDIGESNATNYYNSVRFRETVGLYPAVVPNDELTYETVEQLNGGVDIALMGNRIAASIDVYNSVTNNMLVYTPMETYFGYDFRPENSGRLQNNGIDLGVFFRLIDKSVFKWDVQTSLSTVKNEVLEIKGDKLVTALVGAEIVNMPGEQANSFYGYLFEGIFTSTEEAENADLVNERMIPFRGGDARFADLSGPDGTPDGVINNYDKAVLGSFLPEQYGGLNNTFIYKRWELNAFLQFVRGNEVFNYVRYRNESMTGIQNQSTSVLNRWQYEGHETNVPRALWNDPVGNSSFSSRWIEDGSYFRVKNISLSYTIPNDFLTFRNAQFYISASNVFTLSQYLGYDPEFSYSFTQMEQGIDYGLTPQPRQFMVGVKLGL